MTGKKCKKNCQCSRHTSVTGRTEEDVFQRFFDKVNIDGPIPAIAPLLGQCWEWEGTINPVHNYGQIWFKGEYHRVHRFSYWLHIGNLVDGLVIEHLCNNKICVNPNHLEQTTVKVNTNRAIDDGLRTIGHPYRTGYRIKERR